MSEDNKAMTESGTAPPASNATKAAPAASGKSAGQKEPKQAKTGLLWTFVLLTLGISGAAGYGVYHLLQQGEAMDTRTATQDSFLSQNETAIVDLRGDLTEFREQSTQQSSQQINKLRQSIAESNKKAEEKLGLMEKSITKQARHIRELSSTNRDEWLVAEVEYLLRIANQRILMSKDSSGALAMLNTADNILQEIDDVSLNSVRRAIVKDMTSLKTTDQVDVDGTYMQLAALTDQLRNLDLYEVPDFGMPQIENTPVEEQANWQETLSNVGSNIAGTFKKAFVVRRADEPVEAMLPPQDELYLRQNLRLMLEQAQLALVARNPVIYKESLSKAQAWLSQYFMAEKSSTQAALQTLAELSELNVDPPLPDISGSFLALKGYQQAMEARRPGLPDLPPDAAAAEPEPDPAPAPAPAPAPEQEPSAPENVAEPAVEQEAIPVAETIPVVETAPVGAESVSESAAGGLQAVDPADGSSTLQQTAEDSVEEAGTVVEEAVNEAAQAASEPVEQIEQAVGAPVEANLDTEQAAEPLTGE